jgi:dipeptidyl aminopeptidase/acylaminoacyl peptidase
MSQGSWIEQFPGNMVWSNACLITKGMAHYGAAALGEIDEVCQRLAMRQSEPDAWREEWCAMGAHIERFGDEAERRGHRLTAGDHYLRAGMYWFTAERFVSPGDRKREIARKALELKHKGLERRYPNVERIEVPYEGASLPALLMKAPAVPGRAPAVVVFNGMDNCKEMSVLFAGLEFARRGWHTLAIDGPGQGESLRLRGLYARHDYEVPGSAAFEYMAGRTDVDSRKLVVMGYSFGGYYATRIAALERRYCAGVAMSAPHWDLAAWQRDIKRRQDADPKSTPQSTFHFRWIMGCLDDADAAIRKAEGFSPGAVARAVTMPFLIVHGVNDKVVPVGNAHKLHEAIGSACKRLEIITADEGGSYHAQMDNRQIGITRIADWIHDNLERSQ